MSLQPGYESLIKIDSTTLAGRRSVSMDAEADMAEGTTGESTNQWKEYVSMYKGMEFSMDGLVDPAHADETPYEAIAKLTAGTKVTAYFGGAVGDQYYEGDGYIRHVHIDGPYDDLKSYSLDIIITGEPSTGAVT